MQNIITSDIARLALHDSSFEKIVRHDQTLILVFDWSKFLNFIENNIDKPIIIGKTTMRFTGVSSEEFRLYKDGRTSTVYYSKKAMHYVFF